MWTLFGNYIRPIPGIIRDSSQIPTAGVWCLCGFELANSYPGVITAMNDLILLNVMCEGVKLYSSIDHNNMVDKMITIGRYINIALHRVVSTGYKLLQI